MKCTEENKSREKLEQTLGFNAAKNERKLIDLLIYITRFILTISYRDQHSFGCLSAVSTTSST